MYTQVLYTEKVAVFQPFNESPDRDYKWSQSKKASQDPLKIRRLQM